MTRASGSTGHRVLIVDDQDLQRSKLAHAVRALGHEPETAESGTKALRQLVETRFDVVLLDLLMPEVDGFEVMDVMRRDRRLRDIPVIVVSALEGEMESVVRAVEAGADDVLPKRFDAVLLAARLDSALERVRARAREGDHRRHMQRLVDAAALVEHRAVLAEPPGLAETCAREDEIGRLARVFVQMTREVGARDARLRRQLERLRGAGLAAGAAIVLGLALPLARTALAGEPRPFGLALWLGALCATLCLSIALWRGRLPARHAVRPARVAALALGGGLLGVLPLLWLAGELPASVLATVLPAEVLFASVLAPMLARRRPRAAELLAIMLGLAATVLLPALFGPAPWRVETLAVALLAPFGWAIAALVVSRARPDAGHEAADEPIDALATVGLVALLATLCVLPVAVAREELLPLFGGGAVGGAGPVVLLLAAVLASGATLGIALARIEDVATRAFATLALALATIAWSVIVLGERVPWALWPSLALFAVAAFVRATDRAARSAPASGVPVPDLRLG